MRCARGGLDYQWVFNGYQQYQMFQLTAATNHIFAHVYGHTAQRLRDRGTEANSASVTSPRLIWVLGMLNNSTIMSMR